MTAKASNGVKGFILVPAVVFLVVGISVSAAANQRWIPLTSGDRRAPQLAELRSDFDLVEFEIQIPGVWSEEIVTKGGEFTHLSLSGAGITSAVGQPQLPVITKMVQIPYGAEVSLNVESFQVMERSLEELGITTRIAPAQPPVPKIEGAWQQTPFAMDRDRYEQDRFLPEIKAEIVETGVIRGHRFAMVAIYPISYNPQAGRIKIYSDIRIKLTLPGSDMAFTRSQLHRYASPPFEKLCGELFVNYATYAPMIKGAPELPIGYLIITLNSFAPLLNDLVEWKTKKGFAVTVAEVPDIGVSKEAIKGYIDDAYDDWEIPPTYVLFVGDVNYIPHWTGSYSSTATDLNYVKMDLDAFADIFRGRLPAQSSLDVNAMVAKLLYYENPTAADLDWMGAACFIASDDAGLMAERTHRYVIQNYLEPAGLECDTIWDRTGGYTYEITDCVNAGKTIVCYSGHGSTSGWGCVPFYQNDVRNLSNPNEYPLVLSHACVTGTYSISECFGETWAKQVNKAGIAFWGASANTMWNEDDILEKRMFQAAFTETCYSIGDMTDKALYHLYQYYDGLGYSRYYLDCYNVLGDPSLDLWTAAAESLDVDCPSIVTTGTSPVSVTVEDPGGAPVFGALVCLYKSGEVFETGYTDAAGQVTLYASPLTMGFIDITVTAHNHLPSLGVIEVGQAKGDLTGDGQVDIGDVVYLVNYLYKGGPAPNPPDIGDVNCDGATNLGDVVHLVNYLYHGGPPPCS